MQWNADRENQEWYAYDAPAIAPCNAAAAAARPASPPIPLAWRSTGNTYYYSLAGHLVGTFDGANTSFALTDALGSVVSTVQAALNSSTVLGNQLYGSYGTLRYQQGTMGTRRGFTGQYTDGTGLDYFNARYYDPLVGLFLSVDSVEGNGQGMNPYAYVGGNPQSRTDPSGQAYTDFGGQGSSTPPAPTPSAPPVGGGGNLGGGACNSSTCYDGSGHSTPNPTAPSPPVTPPSPQSTPHPSSGGGSHPSSSGSGNHGVQPTTGGSHSRAQTSSPSVAQVTKALGAVAGVAGTILWEALDLVFNFSGMWRDVETITDPQANFWSKAAAVADLGFTIFTDINMLDGEGEAARAAEVGAEIAEKGVADVEEKGLGDVAECALSFTPDTQVATKQGKQAISTLVTGEQVWAYNLSTGKLELQPIERIWINHDNDLVDLTLSTTTAAKAKQAGKAAQQPTSEVIHTTSKHPFLTLEKGFLPVGQIKLGMHVREGNGQVGLVTGWKVVPGVKVMYNLEVAQDHTFVVGDGLWVVHNCSAPVKGWIQHDTYNDIRNRFDKKGVQRFVNAMKKGFVTAAKGEQGIKTLDQDTAKRWGYQYELKVIGGPEGDYRAYGNFDSESGFIIFDEFSCHK